MDQNYEDNIKKDKTCYIETVKNVKLARAYVPFQVFDEVYNPVESLKKGTVFPDLCDLYKF